MLPKKLRLVRHDFLVAKKQGKQYRNLLFAAVVLSNNLSYSRFAVVTSNKLDKKATVRNRLRRQIYEAVQNLQLPSSDIIIFPRPEVLKLTYEKISVELNSFLSKILGVS